MKEALFACLALAFVLGIFVSQPAGANDKVEVCHIIAANEEVFFFNQTLLFGKVISVSEKAVPAHDAHGDSICFFPPEDAAGPIEMFREVGGRHLPAANCFFGVNDDGDQLTPAACL